MQNYAIHRKPADGAVYVVSNRPEEYTILTLVGEVDADSPLEAAKTYIGQQRGKTLVVDDVEALSNDVSRISYHWHA
jgi:hypothetical protein